MRYPPSAGATSSPPHLSNPAIPALIPPSPPQGADGDTQEPAHFSGAPMGETVDREFVKAAGVPLPGVSVAVVATPAEEQNGTSQGSEEAEQRRRLTLCAFGEPGEVVIGGGQVTNGCSRKDADRRTWRRTWRTRGIMFPGIVTRSHGNSFASLGLPQ